MSMDIKSADTRTIWQIDPSHTTVEFSIRHMMFSKVKGSFSDVQGQIVADEADRANSSVEVTIDTASVNTNDNTRDEHLRNEDFFNVEIYPTITFKSTSVEPVDEQTLNVTGNLRIRGVSREVTLRTTINGRGTNPWGQEVAAATATTSINRDDFGLTWNAPLEAGGVLVGNTVDITIEVQAVKQD